MIASDELRNPECSLPPCLRVVEHSSEPLPLRSRQGQRSFCCSDYSNWSDIGPRSNGPRLGGWITIAAYSIFICLVGSIPAASLNAVVLSRFARRGADEAVVSAISGGTIGFLVAIIFVAGFSGSRLDALFVLWFSATGTMMGLLHWVIAIRPQRRWRLSLLRDDEAIRAME